LAGSEELTFSGGTEGFLEELEEGISARTFFQEAAVELGGSDAEVFIGQAYIGTGKEGKAGALAFFIF
jgi:hypothetical protein